MNIKTKIFMFSEFKSSENLIPEKNITDCES